MNYALTLSAPMPVIFRLKLSLKILLAASLISTICLLIFYVFQINSLTKEVYLIQNYEKNLTQLNRENKTLEIDFSRLNSLANVDNYLQNQNFEKTKQVKFIKILESTVARNITR